MSKSHHQDNSMLLDDAINKAVNTRDIESARRLAAVLVEIGYEEEADKLRTLANEWNRIEWTYDTNKGN